MLNLNMDQLHIFIRACEMGSFSAVARELGRAQSSVSHQIQNLELDLGLVLFDREGKYPRPTAAALALLPLARQSLGQLHRFQQAADSYERGEESSLNILFEELVMPDRLNDMLASFGNRFPHTQLQLSSTSGEDAVARVARGEANFAFVTSRDSYPNALDFTNLGQQRVLSLACPEHPLAQQNQSSLGEAARHRQIVTASDAHRHRWQLSAQMWSCDSLLQALDLACKGIGWVNAPYELARPFLKSGRLIELNLTNALNTWCLGVDLLCANQIPRGSAGQWFAREARRLYGNYYSPPIEITDRN
ncbi:LysR family transcriptional regulator [Microbulbifer sp. OS29]|uniref:LysR family transcriptional regulator n=1 Tax=Microbulbifer okhotskensis TaxID=2926617 RepID=A0A9X2J3I1_9GAMM|nr:LysR family transcriptional regulator [Microbulbifer okhotskensis]MCO1333058.1 LysR family transcriptional regulator [Microbulbifer okhotskensis]